MVGGTGRDTTRTMRQMTERALRMQEAVGGAAGRWDGEAAEKK
jgi:hypothetical protein